MEKKENSKKKSTKPSTKSAAKKNASAKKATVKTNSAKKQTTKNNKAKQVTAAKKNSANNKKIVVENKKEVEKTSIEAVKADKVSSNNFLNDPRTCKNLLCIACLVIIALVAVIIAIALAKRVPETKNGKDVVASVDGLTITSDKLYQNLSDSYGLDVVTNMIDEYIANKEVTKLTDENNKYIKQVVDYYKQYADYYGVSFEDFLKSYVGISGVTNESEFKDYVTKDYKKTLAIQKYVGSKLTDKEIQKYYDDKYSEKLTARVILIEPDSEEKDEDKAKSDALSTAKDLIKKLDKVKDDDKKLDEKFASLAYDNSADSSYEDKGLKKNIMKKDVDSAFWQAASKLKDGEYTTSPVESEYGYYIILRKSSKKKDALKDVKADIIKTMAEEKLSSDSTLNAKSWDQLRKKYKLKINSTSMKKDYKKKLSDSEKTEKKADNSKETTTKASK